MFGKKKNIEWLTELYAPRHYPAYLVSGECFWFYHENVRQGLGFWGKPSGGWRETGVMTSGGSPDHPVALPLGVHLIWLSMTEKKYYQLVAKLPQEKIQEAFANTYDFEWDKQRNHAKHSMIQFALAPNGFVALRVGGSKTIEVANYLAEQIDIPWEFFARSNQFSPELLPEQEFFDDHYHTLPPYVQKQVDDGDFPLTRWQEYSGTTFDWRLMADFEVFGCRIGCVNGDSEFFSLEALRAREGIAQRFVPAWLKIYHKENGRRLETFIRFTNQKQGIGEEPTDDVEVFQFFKKHVHPQRPSTLILTKQQSDYQAILKDGANTIVLPIQQVASSYVDNNDLLWF